MELADDPIFRRTSVRAFTPEKLTEKEAELLLRAAMAAPSATNQQPWEFWVADAPVTLGALADASPFAAPTAKAALAIVPCLRTEGLRVPEMAAQDMGAMAENILLEATELGLGAVWQGIYPDAQRMEQVRRALRIAEDLPVAPFAIIAVGHPAKTPQPTGPARFDPARIHRIQHL